MSMYGKKKKEKKEVNMSTCADKISWAQATSHKCAISSDSI